MSDPVDDSKRPHDALIPVEQADGTKWVVGHTKITKTQKVLNDYNDLLNNEQMIKDAFKRAEEE